MLIPNYPPSVMRYDDAIDLAFKLNKDDPQWKYRVEIEASTGKAKISIHDEDEVKLGYL
jgi:hypothetical protein